MTTPNTTVIVTGGNSGLGYECAKNIALNDQSLHIVLACRSMSRGGAAAAMLRAETGNLNVSAMELDLASLASVRMFCTSFAAANTPPLSAVVCNAGISAAGVPASPQTADGFEMIFGVNHLGHFLLTNLLLNQMGDGSRIIFVTSDLHNPPAFFPVKVTYDNASAIASGHAGMLQYCTSKLCNIYCAYEMDRRVTTNTDRHVTVNAFNPGAMSDTGFSRPTGNAFVRAAVRVVGGIMGALIGKHSTSIESGALLARLVTDPSFANTSGKYFDRGAQAESSTLSHNRDNARELWASSAKMSGLLESETIFTTPATAG
ncbi:MAG: SDR family NAD(P)-dependent oxidoreductase [Lacisediminihabitans sp.]